jgi:hypothetical protein
VSKLISAVVLALATAVLTIPGSQAVGPGGWDHLGTGATASMPALNNDVLALNTDLPGQLLVGGKFTGAGGVAGRDRLASWNGTSWSTVGGAGGLTGEVRALATAGAKVYVGGVFQNAGGNTQADFLAVWDGAAWGTVCNGTPLTGNVDALAVIGNTIYVGGEYQDGFGIAAADYLVACDLTTGTASTTTSVLPFSGPVYALAADSGGKLYAGGNFGNLEGNTASDYVAAYSAGSWASLGFGPGNSGHVTGIVRSLATFGTDLYIGSDGVDVATIPTADHVARWDGSQWHPLGSNGAGNGYLPAVTSVYALHVGPQSVFVSGAWVNAGGNPRADYIAEFNLGGQNWLVPGHDGGNEGPLNQTAEAMAIFNGVLHVGGNFTAAGGDALAKYVARYAGIPLPAKNQIKIVKLQIFKRFGTAELTVRIPGGGLLEVLGQGVKHPDKSVDEKGKVVLKIRPTRGTRAELRDDGKAKVTVKVRFTPIGGTAHTEKIKVTLVLLG